jgi:hypothetical protein
LGKAHTTGTAPATGTARVNKWISAAQGKLTTNLAEKDMK